MRRLDDINNDFFVNHIDTQVITPAATGTSCVAGTKPEMPGRLGRDAKTWSTALSTALETAEATVLDS